MARRKKKEEPKQTDIIKPIMYFKGDSIPVSAIPDDGIIPTATTKLEKRGVAIQIPQWNPDNCIQCGFCSLVCSHATIRIKQISPIDLKSAPEGFTTLKSNTYQ